MPGIFFTGTDTDVGKTYVTALAARQLAAAGHKVGVYKPVASGCRREEGTLVSVDALAIWEAAGRPVDLYRVCPQRFEASLAPHLAAAAEDRDVDEALLRKGVEYWTERSDFVLVEGAGGLLSPLTAGNYYVADLAADLQFPVVIVARNKLGTINQTLLTVAAAQARKLLLVGIVLNDQPPGHNDSSVESNLRELESRCDVPVLACVSWQGNFDRTVDWMGL